MAYRGYLVFNDLFHDWSREVIMLWWWPRRLISAGKPLIMMMAEMADDYVDYLMMIKARLFLDDGSRMASERYELSDSKATMCCDFV